MNKIIIEREKLEHNIHLIKDKIKDLERKPKIIAVIKGNAYGLDAIFMAQKLIDFNIDFFAVSELSEAKKLRQNGFNNDILLLESTCIEREIEEIIELNLIATVGSYNSIKLLDEKAKESDKVINVHLKIDTGFGRFGFLIDEFSVKEISAEIKHAENISVVGTYSHFSEAYSCDGKNTEQQFERFQSSVRLLNSNGIDTGMLHICNSSAFFKYPHMYLDAVRIGSAFTGRLQIKEATGLKRVGYLESEICEIKELQIGSKIGYSGTYILKRNSKIGIIEAGYEAGIGVTGPKDSIRFIDKLRKLKLDFTKFFSDERLFVEICGNKCPIIGRVGMKNTIVDITDIDANVGDKVKIPINLIFANSNIERQEL